MTYEVLQAIITLAAALITAFLIPYIKTKTTATQQATIKHWVDIAVEAAEQLYKACPKSGDDKKEWVLEFLESKGIKLTLEELNALIESAVSKLK